MGDIRQMYRHNVCKVCNFIITIVQNLTWISLVFREFRKLKDYPARQQVVITGMLEGDELMEL